MSSWFKVEIALLTSAQFLSICIITCHNCQRAMDGTDTAARRSSARQRALLALHGAAVAALLLSAAMYASDRVALASAVEAKARQCSLVNSYASSLQSSLAVLDAKVRAWLARSGRPGNFEAFVRSQLRLNLTFHKEHSLNFVLKN